MENSKTIEFDKYKILTFDCYGTLIDWEGGILTALKPVLTNHNINLEDKQILELYAEIESNSEETSAGKRLHGRRTANARWYL